MKERIMTTKTDEKVKTPKSSKSKTRPEPQQNQELPALPPERHPRIVTKTDKYNRPVRIMMPRELPTKGFERGFSQPSYQMKEEELGTKWQIYGLQEKHPDRLYAMFSSIGMNKKGVKFFWWKIIGPDAIKYKYFYRNKLVKTHSGPIKLSTDSDNFFHSDDGVASVNNIDWLREHFREIGVDSTYLTPFIVEFQTNHLFSDIELDNYRNQTINLAKAFREKNQPKNIDVDYKKCLDSICKSTYIITKRKRRDLPHECRILETCNHNLIRSYRNYCNGDCERQVWQIESKVFIQEIETSLYIIEEQSQNLSRQILVVQENLSNMKPSLLQKKDIDKIAKDKEKEKNQSQPNPKKEIQKIKNL